MIVFYRAYNYYIQFAKFTEKQINFVCRLNNNAVCTAIATLYCQNQSDSGFGVLKEELIVLKYTDDGQEKFLSLRKVTFRDDKGRIYEFF